MAVSIYSDLYKNRNSDALLEHKQFERRQQLLAIQKQQRSKDQDDSRNIEQFVQTLNHNNESSKRWFDKYVQFPEKLKERPSDLENWLMVPCPKGQRCIAVATNGLTKIFSKYGRFVTAFHSGLPGDISRTNSTTILDCFCLYFRKVTKYMVVDVMCYANIDMTNCDTSFRFFWIKSKLAELSLGTVNLLNQFEFLPMKYVDCADQIAVDICLTTYPMWENKIKLAGFLFYHKESSYVHGTTPLVGWLFSFMLNEIMGFREVNPTYLEQRPVNYINAQIYFDEFESAKILKRNQLNEQYKNCVQKMEVEYDEERIEVEEDYDENHESDQNF